MVKLTETQVCQCGDSLIQILLHLDLPLDDILAVANAARRHAEILIREQGDLDADIQAALDEAEPLS